MAIKQQLGQEIAPERGNENLGHNSGAS